MTHAHGREFGTAVTAANNWADLDDDGDIDIQDVLEMQRRYRSEATP